VRQRQPSNQCNIHSSVMRKFDIAHYTGETDTHILCECEAIAYLRFRHLGHYFMEPGDCQDAPVSKILHFIRSVGLLEG
jgi:hypothetical protein